VRPLGQKNEEKSMKFVRLTIATLLMIAAQCVFAVGATKIAVVDVQGIVLASDVGKKAMEELEKNKDYAAVKAKVGNFEAELKTLDEKAKSEGLTWGDDKKKENQTKMENLLKERQTALATLNRARETVFMQLLKMMEPGIASALDAVKAAEGIDLVMDARSAVSKSSSADISTMVLERLNKINAQAEQNAKKAASDTKTDKKADAKAKP
jgi:outer membrane protein